jgi:hypothetical protein
MSYVKITQKLLICCKLFIDECAKKCGVAEHKHQALLISLVLALSGILESVVCVVVVMG